MKELLSFSVLLLALYPTDCKDVHHRLFIPRQHFRLSEGADYRVSAEDEDGGVGDWDWTTLQGMLMSGDGMLQICVKTAPVLPAGIELNTPD